MFIHITQIRNNRINVLQAEHEDLRSMQSESLFTETTALKISSLNVVSIKEEKSRATTGKPKLERDDLKNEVSSLCTRLDQLYTEISHYESAIDRTGYIKALQAHIQNLTKRFCKNRSPVIYRKIADRKETPRSRFCCVKLHIEKRRAPLIFFFQRSGLTK